MNFKSIGTDRQFRDCTGMSRGEFDQLSRDFAACFEQERGCPYAEYIEQSCEETPRLKTLEDALFFVLFQTKNDLIFGSLGATFGMSPSSAHKNFTRFTDLLARTLEKKSDAGARVRLPGALR